MQMKVDGFTYEGVEIRINNEGNFTAELGGETVSKPSLKALKAYLKEHKRETFTPFDALYSGSYSARDVSDRPRSIRIVGFERTKNRLHGALHAFKVEGWTEGRWGRRSVHEVLADTKENNERIESILRLQEERDEIASKYERQISDLRNALDTIRVTDFVKEI